MQNCSGAVAVVGCAYPRGDLSCDWVLALPAFRQGCTRRWQRNGHDQWSRGPRGHATDTDSRRVVDNSFSGRRDEKSRDVVKGRFRASGSYRYVDGYRHLPSRRVLLLRDPRHDQRHPLSDFDRPDSDGVRLVIGRWLIRRQSEQVASAPVVSKQEKTGTRVRTNTASTPRRRCAA